MSEYGLISFVILGVAIVAIIIISVKTKVIPKL
jgi:hypothetical protein